MSKNKQASPPSQSNKIWWITFGILCGATFLTRYYKVLEPDHVCWDETHFGKMASWYINRTFFFDVHPPLGKMLIALSGKLTGYDGTFPFEKPGDKYEGARYEGMRMFCTTLGALVIPLTFLTIWEMTKSLDSTFIGTMLLLCDVGFLTLNRYILLDPILLFFMSCSIYGAFKVRSLTDDGLEPFSPHMIIWQLFLGTALACTISVKFVGLFVVLFVGLRTIADLWNILGQLDKPVSLTVKHLFARTITLILWPAVLYVFFFWIHLTVLSKSGNGDGFYSSGFQARLEGNSLHNASAPRIVAYGAAITLKNHRTGGGYLHSHYHLYPAGVGARQQQITTYTHKDDNNRWIIKPYDKEQVDGVVIVRSGDLVRLTHAATGRNLHSHREKAPLTTKFWQVTGYGENGIGDANDVWKVVITGGKDGDEVQTVRSKLMFVHYLQACALTTSGRQLPKWGYEQQEVACNPNLRDKNALWNVEDNVFEDLPKMSFEAYASGFVERFLESHAVMLQGNAGLKPKEGEVTSRPWQWPINYRGQFFSGSAHRIYLLGNPVVWWTNLVFLAVFFVIYIVNAVRQKRAEALGIRVLDSDAARASKMQVLLNAAGWSVAGWALHYVPFWAMGRVLYFHHYFPALVFSSMLTGILTEYLLSSIRSYLNAELGRTLYHCIVGLVISTTVYSFYLFSPLAYGMTGPLASEPNSTMTGLKWLDSWEF
ncbi:protein O-mannosyl-transferase 2 isoform X2 [Ostrinia furnacalis]|uniref:protein O-mannosyl-transferase 2 isoform X1 n=1 Tax=Ostrinia furnacalis TaxID=93504 RepID=UPI00103BE4AB|nr:protein O-mannosyl-transferase 2 isoform X1 [Ostrinia furnacalis]XP_028176825.1 protein O-mannosyl-transferase 2 isoform X2 [Ostrinia furnacalis]